MANQYDIGDLVSIYGTFTDIDNALVDPTTISIIVKSASGTMTTYVYGTDVEVSRESIGVYRCNISPTVPGIWYYKWEGIGSAEAAEESYFLVKEDQFQVGAVVPRLQTGSVSLQYLLPYLRLKIGDINSASYRYTDGWLLIALSSAVRELGKWWSYKYLIDENDKVSRSTTFTFDLVEPPIIQMSDEAPIICMAALIVLEGSLENSAWNVGSWKDAEISFSNIESGRIRNDNLKRLWDELTSMISPPSKRLAKAIKGSLPGYIGNSYERIGEY